MIPAGYAKWDMGSIGWTLESFGTTNGLSGGTPMYAVSAQASNVLDDLMALTALTDYTPSVTDSTIPPATLNAGRYLRVS